MDNSYILVSINDAGLRRITAAAATPEDLGGIAEKIVTFLVKAGYVLADVIELDPQTDPEDGGVDKRLYKAYYLKRPKTRTSPPSMAVLEFYELPIMAPADYDINTFTLSYY